MLNSEAPRANRLKALAFEAIDLHGLQGSHVVLDRTGRIVHFSPHIIGRIGADIRTGQNLLELPHILADATKSRVFADLIHAGKPFHLEDFDHAYWAHQTRAELRGMPLMDVQGGKPVQVGSIISNHDLTARIDEDTRLSHHRHTLGKLSSGLKKLARASRMLREPPHRTSLVRRELDQLEGKIGLRRRKALESALDATMQPFQHPDVVRALEAISGHVTPEEYDALVGRILMFHPLTSAIVEDGISTVPALSTAIDATIDDLGSRHRKPEIINWQNMFASGLKQIELPRDTVVRFQTSERAVFSMLPPVDAVALVQNLLHNAVDALREHQPANPLLAVSLVKRGGHVKISVVNSGQIPKATLEAINAGRIGRNVSTKSKGQGIGVSHLKQVVNQNGGELKITGARGFTTFQLRIPAVTPPEE